MFCVLLCVCVCVCAVTFVTACMSACVQAFMHVQWHAPVLLEHVCMLYFPPSDWRNNVRTYIYLTYVCT